MTAHQYLDERRWVSRLRPTYEMGLPSDLELRRDHQVGFLPHLRGRPIREIVNDPHSRVEVCVPNIAGVVERHEDADVVLWDRRLAATPQGTHVVGYGTPEPSAGTPERVRWFGKLVRRLEQIRGVICTCDFDVSRAILLTQGGGDITAAPDGVTPVPPHLSEFAGGMVLTMLESDWSARESYAGDIEAWFATTEAS